MLPKNQIKKMRYMKVKIRVRIENTVKTMTFKELETKVLQGEEAKAIFKTAIMMIKTNIVEEEEIGKNIKEEDKRQKK